MPVKVIGLSLSLGIPVANASKLHPHHPKKETTFHWFHPEYVVVMMILPLIFFFYFAFNLMRHMEVWGKLGRIAE